MIAFESDRRRIAGAFLAACFVHVFAALWLAHVVRDQSLVVPEGMSVTIQSIARQASAPVRADSPVAPQRESAFERPPVAEHPPDDSAAEALAIEKRSKVEPKPSPDESPAKIVDVDVEARRAAIDAAAAKPRDAGQAEVVPNQATLNDEPSVDDAAERDVAESPGAETVTVAAAKREAIRTTYIQLLAAWLDRQKYYPPQARRMGMEGEVVVKILIDDRGRVRRHGIERAGPYSILTATVTEMVARADPFPPIPEYMDAGDFEFEVPVRFEIADAD